MLSYWRDEALAGAWLMDASYRNHHFDRHLHDEMTVVVTEIGSGEVKTRWGTERSSPDTVWVFAAGEYHSGRTMDDAGEWGYKALYLDESAIGSLEMAYGDRAQGRLFVPPGLYSDAQLARALAGAHGSRAGGAPLMERQTHWWTAIAMLFGRYGKPKGAFDDLQRPGEKMQAVREYIAAHFARDISIDELSTLTGLSRFHLIRAFRRAYGLPPHAYANQLRLIEAKRLLRGGRSPAEVALAVGFYDQSHLNKQFKRAFSLTPASFAALG
jgi:AraC-like DNA-binding protein